MATTARPCKGTNRQGQPCSATIQEGSEWCFFHDPLRAKDRVQARRRGGKARHGRQIGKVGEEAEIVLESAADVLALLERTANDLLKMENSVSRAKAMTGIASVAVSVIDTSELEGRLQALEAELYGKRSA